MKLAAYHIPDKTVDSILIKDLSVKGKPISLIMKCILGGIHLRYILNDAIKFKYFNSRKNSTGKVNKYVTD